MFKFGGGGKSLSIKEKCNFFSGDVTKLHVPKKTSGHQEILDIRISNSEHLAPTVVLKLKLRK